MSLAERNVAYDKTVQLNKKHEDELAVKDAAETVQPGKKPTLKHRAKDDKEAAADAADPNASE